VRACLAKDRDERRQSARDVMRDLEWMAAGEASAPGRPVARSRERLVWMTATVVLFAAALAFAVAWFRRPPASAGLAPTAIRFSVPVPASGIAATGLSISPDGRRLVLRAPGPDGRPVLWVRTLHDLTAHALPGTEGTGGHFWSPDSRFLAFFAGGKLKKIEASGGRPKPSVTLQLSFS